MNIKLPTMIDLGGRNINPAHIAFFLPARQQETGEPDPARTLVIPMRGKAYKRRSHGGRSRSPREISLSRCGWGRF